MSTCQGVIYLGDVVNLFLVFFLNYPQRFTEWLEQFAIPATVNMDSLSSWVFQHLLSVVLLTLVSHADWGEMKSQSC